MTTLSGAQVRIGLLAAPSPLPRESRLSWVQRLCGEHQYSQLRMKQISGISPIENDWDTGVTQPEWNALLGAAGMPLDGCAEASYAFDVIARSHSANQHVLCANLFPRYRWCAECFSSDPIPYLRWEWRLVAMRHCSIHRLPLSSRCGWCDSYLRFSRATLVSAGAAVGVPDLATCPSCGMPLFERDSAIGGAPSVGDEELVASMREMDGLVARLRQGYLVNDSHLILCFPSISALSGSKVIGASLWPNLADGQRIRSSSGAAARKSMAESRGSLLINGDTFRDRTPMAVRTGVVRESVRSILLARSRSRLARALLVFRAEMRVQRHSSDLERVETGEGNGI